MKHAVFAHPGTAVNHAIIAAMATPPVCDYEGSPYQQVFWDSAERKYEDLCEASAIRKLLPKQGKLLLELGAGAGRNTPRYTGFERIILLDYSRTQLARAKERLGDRPQLVFVAANIYKLPFADCIFDCATMIRVLHHMADPLAALREISRVLESEATFLLEYANKRNMKSILRYILHRQKWSPFSRDAVEFAPMNFDYHPSAIRSWIASSGMRLSRQITVSHFRVGFLKRLIPPPLLAWADSCVGLTGDILQYSPSVFSLSYVLPKENRKGTGLFQCPECRSPNLVEKKEAAPFHLLCEGCGRRWPIVDGIYDFKEPFAG